MALSTKPTILISSTIYDFADLRSALKYWLAELGYDVMLSDFNDFPKTLDANSYDACLQAITKAEYFVLLIGTRVGGWVDKAKRVSITRMEYRTAIESFQKTGKPRLAIFVRQNIWDIREDRNALEKYLDQDHELLRELSDEAKMQLAKHPSRFVNDADTTFEFIKEVGQVEAMKAASSGTGDFPKANWIHQFSTFADIANALRVAFGVNIHAERILLIENLRQEIVNNLTHLFHKQKIGMLTPFYKWGIHAASKIIGGVDSQSKMPAKYVKWLLIFRIFERNIPSTISSLFIEHAIESGLFMKFDALTSSYQPTHGHLSLMELLTLILDMRRFLSARPDDFGRYAKKFALTGGDEEIAVENLEVAAACMEVHRLKRMTDLHVGLLKWIQGDEDSLTKIDRTTASPFPEEAERINKERITPEEITAFFIK